MSIPARASDCVCTDGGVTLAQFLGRNRTPARANPHSALVIKTPQGSNQCQRATIVVLFNSVA
jgi:hypothetical protein